MGQTKKEGRNGCWDWRLGGKCWRWAEVKELGAQTRSQERQKWRRVRRKEEKWNRNERALLLLIIGGVMRQHSLRGFPPEGMIPWGLRHWNHITAPPQTLAHFLRLLMAKEEGSGHLSALFCPFSWRHSCRFRCAQHWRVLCLRNTQSDIWYGWWQRELYKFLLYLLKTV